MNILLTGIDGYVGWPTALRLSKEVPDSRIIGVDNFGRRRWVEESGSVSAVPIFSMEERLVAAQEHGFGNISFVEGDLSQSIKAGDNQFDFVWGEDTWCYLNDKEKLISEAARVVKPGGIIAFTDWIEGPAGLSDEEAERINTFMKFPYMENQKGYEALLEKYGFEILESTDLTEEFANYVDFYIKMLTDQLTYDALKIIGDNMELFQGLGGEMMYMSQVSHEGKMGRGRFIGKLK